MRTFLVLAGLLFGVAGSALAADPAATVQKTLTVQNTLQADYDTRDKAVARRDIDATLAFYAPEFIGVSRKGKTHPLTEERADFLKTFALPAQSGVTQSTIQKMTLGKAGTVANVTLHRHGVLILTDPQTHAHRTVILDGIYQDAWAKRSGGWRLTREQEISVQATVDGKPL